MLSAMVLAIILPLVPEIMKKILLIIGASIWIGGIYYMILIPGWQPGKRLPLPYTLRLLLFLGIATLLLATVVHYLWFR